MHVALTQPVLTFAAHDWAVLSKELERTTPRITLSGYKTFEFGNVNFNRFGTAGTIEREYWFELKAEGVAASSCTPR